MVEHHPDACRRCCTLLLGDDPEPLRHRVIEIPPITPVVIEHRLHRLVCPCCSTSTCASLPADVEASRYGPRLSALVGLLGRWLMHTDRDLAALGGLVVSSGLAWGYGLTIEVEHDRPRRRTLCELYVKEGDRCARVKSICAWMPLRWRQQGTSHGSRQAPPWAPSTTAISRCWPMCSCLRQILMGLRQQPGSGWRSRPAQPQR